MPRRVTLPLAADDVAALHAGDEVAVSGRLLTARDAAHRYLAEHEVPAIRSLARGSIVYHCGPVVAQDPRTGDWRFVAAGPTQSSRQEPWEAELIARYGLRGVMGKGGMGPRTLAALVEHGAAYLHVAGTLAVTLARRVVRVHGVHLLDELGATDAIWDVEVQDFPAVVSMDAHGESLHTAESATDPASAGA